MPAVRVATFNVKHGLVAPGRGGLVGGSPVDNGRLVGACVDLRADVLALQEVDRRARRSGYADQVEIVARATGMTAAFGEAARKGLFRRYGNALLGRGALSEVEVVGLPRPALGEFRVVVLATLSLAAYDGVRLSVAATHLSYRKAEGPAQLDALVEMLDGRPLPRVLLGDLNLGPGVVEPVLTAAGYAVAPTGATFPADGPRTRIDYVAVAGLEVVAAEAPEAAVSDHRPVVADVRLPERG